MAICLSCLLSTSGRRLVSLLLYLCIVASKSQDGKITCSTEPVKLLEDTVLTCNFPEDLNVTRKEFTVYHYNKGVDSDPVLDCWWLKGSLHCTTRPGIKFNEIVNRSLNLTISKVASEHTGRYACQVNGYDASDFQTCDLELKNGSDSTCDITYDRSVPNARLTCFFNGALRANNITVYKHTGNDKEAVAECMREDKQHRCQVKKGYLLNEEVSSLISIWILETTKDPEVSYSCWYTGSTYNSLDTCSLDALDIGNADQSDHSLEIGLSLGLLLLASLITTTGIIIYVRHKRKLCFKPSKEEQDGEAGETMLEQQTEEQTQREDKVTEMFKNHLLKNVKEMYPKILESFYFVPPVYFNKTRYQKQSVAGHDVYIPKLPDASDVRHDRAMQHVLHCLRHMAEQYQEHMFVLTQFKYEDYLKRPGPQYQQNHLPMPSALEGVDTSVGCFDILIVHRYQGVLLLVVKDIEQHDGQVTYGEILTHLEESLKQLNMAKRIFEHLMKDVQSFPNIHKAVILPNIRKSLLDAVKRFEEQEGFKMDDDLFATCLCAEHLSEPHTPWDVSGDVIQHVKNWWKTLMGGENSNFIMTDDIYLSVIARFFGPATESTLQTADDCNHLILPKTLAEAVSLTGDLYRRQVLYPEMTELFDKSRVFLAGPRSTGKTTMLTITVSKWLQSRKNVFIVKDTHSPRAPFLLHIYESLEKALETSNCYKKQDLMFQIDCDFSTTDGREKCIETIKKTNTKDVCVLIEIHPKGKEDVKTFCERLHNEIPHVNLWVVSNDTNYCPVMGESINKPVTTALNCPPAVVREVRQTDSNLKYSHIYKYPPPTDGPRVKHVYHSTKTQLYPFNSCGIRVGKFLFGLVGKHGASLRLNDILIVLEFSLKQDHIFLKALRQSNIPVQVLDVDKLESGANDVNAASAINVKHMEMYRPKRKVVVYVEKNDKLDGSENKERAFTSCTSQLVLVHCNIHCWYCQ